MQNLQFLFHPIYLQLENSLDTPIGLSYQVCWKTWLMAVRVYTTSLRGK